MIRKNIFLLAFLICFSATCFAQQIIHFAPPVYIKSPLGNAIAHIESYYHKTDKSTHFKISLLDKNGYYLSKISFPNFVPTKCAGLRRNLNDVAFTHNGKYLLTVTGWVSIYSVDQQLMCDDHDVFTPDQIAVWDAGTGRLKTTLSYPGQEKNTANFHTIVCSPNGAYIAVMGDGAVRIWSAKTFKYIKKLPWSNYAEKLLFSPDSKFLLGGRSGVSWLLWDIKTGKLLRKLEDTGGGNENVADDLGFSGDGNVIAGTISGNTITKEKFLGIWSTQTGKLLYTVRIPAAPTN